MPAEPDDLELTLGIFNSLSDLADLIVDRLGTPRAELTEVWAKAFDDEWIDEALIHMRTQAKRQMCGGGFWRLDTFRITWDVNGLTSLVKNEDENHDH